MGFLWFGRKGKEAGKEAKIELSEHELAEIEAEMANKKTKIIAAWESKASGRHDAGYRREVDFYRKNGGSSNLSERRINFISTLGIERRFLPVRKLRTLYLSAEATAIQTKTTQRSYEVGPKRAGEDLGKAKGYQSIDVSGRGKGKVYIEIIPGYNPTDGKRRYLVLAVFNDNWSDPLINSQRPEWTVHYLEELIKENKFEKIIKLFVDRTADTIK